MQNHYNLIYREEEREMLPALPRPGHRASSRGARWPAGGWPATGTQAARPARGTDAIGRPDVHRRRRRASWSAVARGAEARGLPRAQVALAWVLQQQAVTAPIVGATKPGHVEDAVAALDVELDEDEVAALEKPYVPHPVLGHE